MAWYRELMHDVKRAAAYLPKAPKTIEEFFEWAFKSMATTAAIVRLVGGPAMSDTWADHGLRRLKPKHRAMIRGVAAA